MMRQLKRFGGAAILHPRWHCDFAICRAFFYSNICLINCDAWLSNLIYGLNNYAGNPCSVNVHTYFKIWNNKTFLNRYLLTGKMTNKQFFYKAIHAKHIQCWNHLHRIGQHSIALKYLLCYRHNGVEIIGFYEWLSWNLAGTLSPDSLPVCMLLGAVCSDSDASILWTKFLMKKKTFSKTKINLKKTVKKL